MLLNHRATTQQQQNAWELGIIPNFQMEAARHNAEIVGVMPWLQDALDRGLFMEFMMRQRLFITVAVVLVACDALHADEYDLVISGGRVLDVETKLDGIRNIGIRAGKIVAVSENPLTGNVVLDAKGLVVTSGFIDFHAHGQNIPADRMQAFGGIIASDAMPWMDKDGRIIDSDAWPLQKDAFAHPRTAATYTKFLIDYVRDRKAEALVDAIARCSYRPANILEEYVPQMKHKGRIQAGMDADIIAFDLDGLQVRSTYDDPNHHSLGMKHVVANGTLVIKDGKLDTKASPGQPARRSVR